MKYFSEPNLDSLGIQTCFSRVRCVPWDRYHLLVLLAMVSSSNVMDFSVFDNLPVVVTSKNEDYEEEDSQILNLSKLRPLIVQVLLLLV
jgi:hypothetical protein